MKEFERLLDNVTRDQALTLLAHCMSLVLMDGLKIRDINALTKVLREEVAIVAARRRKNTGKKPVALKVLPTVRRTVPDHELGMKPPWEALTLPMRLRTSLSRVGPYVMRDLVQQTESSMIARKSIGETSVRVLVTELARWGLQLGMTPDEAERLFGPDPRAPQGVDLEQLRALADKDLEEMDFSVRVYNLFTVGGIRTLRQLLAVSGGDMPLLLKHSKVCREEVDRRLQKHGLFVGMSSAEIERLLGPPAAE